MRLLVFDQVHQRPGLIQIIIDTAYQTVLKGQTASCFHKILMTGCQDIHQLILIGHRHQSLTHLIVRGMKG